MSDKVAVLYVDDEINNLNSFKAVFRRDFQVYTAISGEEGQKILRENKIQVIITDQRMPEMTGVEFLESIIPEFPEPMRILLTGYTDIQAVIDAINKGQIYYYLNKPWDEQQLSVVIKNAHEIYRLRSENQRLLDELERTNRQLEFLIRQKLLS